MQNKNVVVKKVCHLRFCRPQDSGISTLFSSSPLEVLSTQCHLFCPPCGESTLKGGKGVVNKATLLDNPPSALCATSPTLGGKSTTRGFTTRSVTPTLRAAIYAGYSGRTGFTLGRHAEPRPLPLGRALKSFNSGSYQTVSASSRSIKGFTLIELLVVVLIIGILAAVAVPQYQKAVEKSQTAQAISLLHSFYRSWQFYYLANGKYPTRIEQLENNFGTRVTTSFEQDWNYRDVYRLNNDWYLRLHYRNYMPGLDIIRRRGKYKGAGFAIFRKHFSAKIPENTLLCEEGINAGTSEISNFAGTQGDYCQKVLGATFLAEGLFKLPQ